MGRSPGTGEGCDRGGLKWPFCAERLFGFWEANRGFWVRERRFWRPGSARKGRVGIFALSHRVEALNGQRSAFSSDARHVRTRCARAAQGSYGYITWRMVGELGGNERALGLGTFRAMKRRSDGGLGIGSVVGGSPFRFESGWSRQGAMPSGRGDTRFRISDCGQKKAEGTMK